jgi:hypothetical protein
VLSRVCDDDGWEKACKARLLGQTSPDEWNQLPLLPFSFRPVLDE